MSPTMKRMTTMTELVRCPQCGRLYGAEGVSCVLVPGPALDLAGRRWVVVPLCGMEADLAAERAAGA